MNDNTNNHFSIPKKQYMRKNTNGYRLLLLAMVLKLKVFTNQVLWFGEQEKVSSGYHAKWRSWRLVRSFPKMPSLNLTLPTSSCPWQTFLVWVTICKCFSMWRKSWSQRWLSWQGLTSCQCAIQAYTGTYGSSWCQLKRLSLTFIRKQEGVSPPEGLIPKEDTKPADAALCS